jgi:arsenate reductase
MVAESPRTLFVCTRGAGRSVIAAALWREDGREARSRGWRPTAAVHPETVQALAEIGLVPDPADPKEVAEEDVAWAEEVILIDCGPDVELPREIRSEEWSLPPPPGHGVEGMRFLRERLRERVAALCSAGTDR